MCTYVLYTVLSCMYIRSFEWSNSDLVYFTLIVFIIVYVLSFIMLFCLFEVQRDAELITGIVDGFCPYTDWQPFGSNFRVFEWCSDFNGQMTRDVTRLKRAQKTNSNLNAIKIGRYRNCSCNCYCYTFIYVIKEILKQIAAWVIHLFACLLFDVFTGFSCSLAFIIHRMTNNYPTEISFITHSKLTTKFPKTTMEEYLFADKLKDEFESVHGSDYLQTITKSKNLIIKVCCLNYIVACANTSHRKCFSKSSMFEKYLNKKHKHCFAGVTMKSLKNNTIIDDKYKNDDGINVISVSKTFKAFIEGMNVPDDNFLWSVVYVAFVLLWCTARLCITLIPLISYVSYFNSNDYDYHHGSELVFALQTGLLTCYLILHCLWIAALIDFIYQFYCYAHYTMFVPYTKDSVYMSVYQLRKEYFRVLTSHMIRNILSEYFHRDLCSLIVFYHDNIYVD